jgi:hypothetical protein
MGSERAAWRILTLNCGHDFIVCTDSDYSSNMRPKQQQLVCTAA